MMGSASAVVVELAGKRHLIGMDKAHKLEIRAAGGPPSVIETRPVTEFSAAVDRSGRLHVAAWLLSRHLMYYTSAEGESFTRSTLLKSDGGLRLKDCLIFADDGVSVVYMAETEYANTLVCYRYDGGEWEGRRVVEVELPQRLSAYQFDGSPAGASIIYGVKETGRTVVMARAATGDTAPEVIATVTGSISDFCALTSGGARQACWLADGHLMTNGLRQTEEPWSRTWPCLRRGDNGSVQCLWLENGSLNGMLLGAQRARLRPHALKDPLPCMLALPGELRRAIVDGQTLKEPALLPEAQERPQAPRSASQPYPGGKEGLRIAQGDLTLTDVVRNQAIYITRMQESVSAMERNMLRMQAEVNRLTKEINSLLKEKEPPRKPEPALRMTPYTREEPMVKAATAVEAQEVAPEPPEVVPEPQETAVEQQPNAIEPPEAVVEETQPQESTGEQPEAVVEETQPQESSGEQPVVMDDMNDRPEISDEKIEAVAESRDAAEEDAEYSGA